MNLSVCLIVKDEAENIFRCLKSIKRVAHEIILVDSGSQDNTLEIAENFKCKVISITWENDFSFARNISLAAATGDWILVLDGDEELAEVDREKLKDLLENPQAAGYYVQIKSYLADGYVLAEKEVRLFKNHPQYRYTGLIQEDISSAIRENNGQLYPSPLVVNHYGYRQSGWEKKLHRKIGLLQLELMKNPLHLPTVVSLGNAYFFLRDFQGASIYYEKIIKARDNFFELPLVLRNLALIHLQRGNYEKGEEILLKALATFEDYTDIYLIYGNLLAKTGRFENSLLYYQQCLKMGETDSYPTIVGSGSYYPLLGMGTVLEKMGLLQEALKVYLEGLKFKEIRDVVIELAVPLATFSKSSILEEIFSLDFTSQQYLALADCYGYWGNYTSCLKILDNFIPSDFVRLFKSYCLLHTGDFSQALEEIQKMKIIDNPRITLNNIFLCGCGLKDDLLQEKAVENLQLFLEPSVCQVYRDLLSGRFLGPENPELYLKQCWILLKEVILLDFKDWAERLIEFASYIDKEGTLARAAIFYWQKGDPLAGEYLDRLNKPSWPIFNLIKGDILLKGGKYQEAEKSFACAADMLPDDQMVQLGLTLAGRKQFAQNYPSPFSSQKELISALERKYNYLAFKKKNYLSNFPQQNIGDVVLEEN